MATTAATIAGVLAHINTTLASPPLVEHEDLSSWELVEIVNKNTKSEDAIFISITSKDDTCGSPKTTKCLAYQVPQLEDRLDHNLSSINLHDDDEDPSTGDRDSQASILGSSEGDSSWPPSFSSSTTLGVLSSPKSFGDSWQSSKFEGEDLYPLQAGIRVRRAQVVAKDACDEWELPKDLKHPWPSHAFPKLPSEPSSESEYDYDYLEEEEEEEEEKVSVPNAGKDDSSVGLKPSVEHGLNIDPRPPTQPETDTTPEVYDDKNGLPSPYPISPPEAQQSPEYEHLVECSLVNRALYEPETLFTVDEKATLHKLGYEVTFGGDLKRTEEGALLLKIVSELGKDVCGPEKPPYEHCSHKEDQNDDRLSSRCHDHCPCYKTLVRKQRFERKRAARRARMMQARGLGNGHLYRGKNDISLEKENLQFPAPSKMTLFSAPVGEDTTSYRPILVEISASEPITDVVHASSIASDAPPNVEAIFEEACMAAYHMQQAWAGIVIRTVRDAPFIVAQFEQALRSGRLSRAHTTKAEAAIEILLDIPRKLEHLHPNPTKTTFTSDDHSESRYKGGKSRYTSPLACLSDSSPKMALSPTGSNSSPSQDAVFRTTLYCQNASTMFTKTQVEDIREFWATRLEQRTEAVNKAFENDKVEETMGHGTPPSEAIKAAGIDTDQEWILTLQSEVIAARFGEDWAPIQMDWFLENLGAVVRLVVEHHLVAGDLEVRPDGVLDVKQHVRMARAISMGFRSDMVAGLYDWNDAEVAETVEEWDSEEWE